MSRRDGFKHHRSQDGYPYKDNAPLMSPEEAEAVLESAAVYHEDQDPEELDGILDLLACERCGTPWQELHCKLICPNCGNRRDCSDP